jgi:hypothetical protein
MMQRDEGKTQTALPSLRPAGKDTKIKNQLSTLSRRFEGFEEQLNLSREVRSFSTPDNAARCR